MSKVSAKDYYHYHKLLLQGIKDLDLLEKMLYDLKEPIEKILAWSEEEIKTYTPEKHDIIYEIPSTHNIGVMRLFLTTALNTKDFGQKHAMFEALVQFTHSRQSIADYVIEGGQETIDRVRNMPS